MVGHLPRDLVRLVTVVTNEELEMSTCEVVDHVPVQAPGLRGLQIAVMLKLRLTNDSKKKRIVCSFNFYYNISFYNILVSNKLFCVFLNFSKILWCFLIFVEFYHTFLNFLAILS